MCSPGKPVKNVLQTPMKDAFFFKNVRKGFLDVKDEAEKLASGLLALGKKLWMMCHVCFHV